MKNVEYLKMMHNSIFDKILKENANLFKNKKGNILQDINELLEREEREKKEKKQNMTIEIKLVTIYFFKKN